MPAVTCWNETEITESIVPTHKSNTNVAGIQITRMSPVFACSVFFCLELLKQHLSLTRVLLPVCVVGRTVNTNNHHWPMGEASFCSGYCQGWIQPDWAETELLCLSWNELQPQHRMTQGHTATGAAALLDMRVKMCVYTCDGVRVYVFVSVCLSVCACDGISVWCVGLCVCVCLW